jgi:hypothetical protein
MSKMFKLAGTLLAGLVLVLSLAQAPTARAEEPVTSDLPPDIKAMKLDPQDPNNRVTTVEFEGITATLVVSPDGKTHRVFTSGGILDEYVGIRVRVRFDENGPYIAKVCGITPEMVDEILAPLPPGYTCEGYPYNGGPSIMGENTGFSTYSHYSEGGLETRAGVYQDYSWDGEDVTEVGDPVPLTAWTSDWRRLDVDIHMSMGVRSQPHGTRPLAQQATSVFSMGNIGIPLLRK